MSSPEKWTRLYVARWSDGSASVISADSMEEVANLLDEVGPPEECEVVPFEGPLWMTFRPAIGRPGRLDLADRSTVEPDSHLDIIQAAFPELNRLIDEDEEAGEGVEPDAWNAALARESRRELIPSEEWRAAVRCWLEEFSRPPKGD